MRRVYCKYQQLLLKYPYRVQAVQIMGLLGLGDVIAQTVDARIKTYNAPRTLKFMSAGIFMGPSIHAWYIILERMYGQSQGIKTVLKKVATDQLLFGPTFLAFLMVYTQLLNRKDWDHIKKTLKNDYPRLLRDNYVVWPAAQVINFSLIPLNYRVLFLQSLGVLWNAYVAWRIGSMMANKEE
uniref:Mitochondrial inner membrane protein Mpv17 n=1 Tax=Panstrongylus lignarius TaxID=156445 RepID=A0A224XZB7_9HEMI